MYLYSALFVVPHTQGVQVRITQCYQQITQYLPLLRKRSPDGASPDWGCGHLIAAYNSLIYPRKDERLSRPGWLTYSGRFTHISGHPSAAGRAQDSESSLVKNQRSIPLCHGIAVSTQYRLVTDRWTDGLATASSALCIASRGENVTVLFTKYGIVCARILHFRICFSIFSSNKL